MQSLRAYLRCRQDAGDAAAAVPNAAAASKSSAAASVNTHAAATPMKQFRDWYNAQRDQAEKIPRLVVTAATAGETRAGTHGGPDQPKNQT